MKKEIQIIDKEKGIIRITTLDERWYTQSVVNEKTGLPEYIFKPSTTWVASYYPKGIGFYKWLANKGWDEAEAIKIAAGEKGSKVHYACQEIDAGKEVLFNSKYKNPTTEQDEEITVEEFECVKSYTDFLFDYQPEVLANELTAFSEISGGTMDKIIALKNEMLLLRQIWIIDLKTGQHIWKDCELQLSDYSHMNVDYIKLGITDEEWNNRKLAILQLGYNGYRIEGKPKYKFTEIKDKYKLFLNAYDTWKEENPDAKPKQRDLPIRLISPLIKEEEKTKVVKKLKKIN